MTDQPPQIRVLVIEDELNMQIFLTNLLRANGFAPIVADSQVEGLARARADQPTLIVMDVMLPSKGELMLYQKLKADRQLDHVPVILLSTIDKDAFCHLYNCQAARVGQHFPEPDAYLVKPPEAEEFISIVQRLAADTEVALEGDL